MAKGQTGTCSGCKKECTYARGLHVAHNLQILNESDNLKKSYSFDGTYDNEGWRKK